MRLKSKYTIYCFLILSFIMISCKKQLELGPPTTLVTTSNVFSNDNTATAAQLSLYAQMKSYPANLHKLMALSSDELVNYSTDQTNKNLYANSLDALNDAQNLRVWSESYIYIFQANSILEGLQTYSEVSNKVKRQLLGESYFLRGYYLFNLASLYGDVLIPTSTDYKVNSTKPRKPIDIVYRQIVDDLKQAADLLSSNYVDASDTAVTVDRIRPTTWAASALLARTYLYMGRYDSAEAQASITIANTSKFSLLSDLSKVFLKNSNEAIWQLQPAGTSLYTDDGNNFSLTGAPGTSGNNYSLSTQLLSAFEPNDQRKLTWTKTFTSGVNNWSYPYKYKDNSKNATTLNEYTMMFRLAEQYLIRAESRAQQGNTAGALADLNAIRRRAGVADYAGASDRASMLTAILHERQVELFTEGDRWANLRRAGILENVMGGPSGVTQAKGGIWDSHSQFYPVPIGDIQTNPNLIQTKGY